MSPLLTGMTDAEFLLETDSLVPKSPVIAEFHRRLTAAADACVIDIKVPTCCPVCEAELLLDYDSEAKVLHIVG